MHTKGIPILFCAGVLSACGSSSPLRGLDRADAASRGTPRTSSSSSDVLATLNGSPIPGDRLETHLREATGGLVLDEVCLHLLLEREAERLGIRVTGLDVQAEEERLAQTLAQGTDLTPNQRTVLLRSIRQSRGLGETRYGALLKRNALLRALVREEAAASITESDIRRAYDIRHGDRYRVRLILANDARSAQRARDAVLAGSESFGEVAQRYSIDSSAQRGGLLEPISPMDPAYDEQLLSHLRTTPTGALSPMFQLAEGTAFFRMEDIVPGDGRPLGQVRGTLVEEIRLVRERALMERRGRELLEAASIVVYDDALRWSWDAHRQP